MLRSTALLFCCLGYTLPLLAISDDLPPGPMQVKVKNSCTQCHQASKITKQHHTRADWVKTLDKMIEYGADVSEQEKPGLIDYLSAHFGPEPSGSTTKTDNSVKSNPN